MPRHIEQPANRHSAPASVKTLSRPSASAAARTLAEPGTTSIRTPVGDLVPAQHLGRGAQVLQPAVGAGADEDHVDRRRRAAACPAVRSMYSSARAAARGLAGVGEVLRVGHDAVQRRALARVGAPGDERGDQRLASSVTSVSKTAPSSVGRVRQYATRGVPVARPWARTGGP